jgi:hypothetical protein
LINSSRILQLIVRLANNSKDYRFSVTIDLQIKHIVPGTVLTSSTNDTGCIAALYGNTDTLQQELQQTRFPSFSGNLTSNIPENCIASSPSDPIDLKLNGVQINKVDSCRYLGVIIDDELNCSSHIGLPTVIDSPGHP